MDNMRLTGSLQRWMAGALAVLSVFAVFPLAAYADEQPEPEYAEDTVYAEEGAYTGDESYIEDWASEDEYYYEEESWDVEEESWYEEDISWDGAQNYPPIYYGEDGYRYCTNIWYGGNMVGWLEWDGLWYYFQQDGRMATGFFWADGDWYYFTPETGVVHRGWLEMQEGWRFFNYDNAIMRTGWLYLDGRWFYFDADGVMATGWRYIDGDWYYFESDGVVFRGGWKALGDNWLYLRVEDALPQKGWAYIDGYWYFFWESGARASGWCNVWGTWYYFEPDTGIVHRGWVPLYGEWYYMRPEDGTKQTYWRYIDGYWYYFGMDGKMRTGWNRIDGYDYYFYKDNDPYGGPVGAEAHDVWVDDIWLQSDGTAWSFNSPYDTMIRNAQSKSSKTEYLIMVDVDNCVFGVFQGWQGNWTMLYYWDCSPGAYSTPTVRGEFEIEEKGDYFYSGSAKCLYWSAFYRGEYAIHSTLRYSDNSPMDSRLGMHLSHGCVRLNIDNAYWVWTTCPMGTAVVTY